MKEYNLKETSKRKVIGEASFIYDKAFQGKYDKYAKFLPKQMSIKVYEGETEEQVIRYVQKGYKNAKNIQIKYENR